MLEVGAEGVELGLGFDEPKRRREPRELSGVGEVKGREEVMEVGSMEEEEVEVEDERGIGRDKERAKGL